MPQQEYYHRPPIEADSFIIRVMRGCPHNKCTFCGTYKNEPCYPLPLNDILAGIDSDRRSLGERFLPLINSVYLEGADPLFLPTEMLLTIMRRARESFPALERFACYASARFTVRKRPEEIVELGRAGLRRVYMGLESGNRFILKNTRKGCSREDLAMAGACLTKAGIENDVSIMMGIGGQAFSSRHAEDTADLLNRMRPVCLRIRTFVPKEDTELGDAYLAGKFSLLGPHAILREMRLMIENLTAPIRLLSEHWTNFIRFDVRLPEGREAILAGIDQALQWPESEFHSLRITPAEEQRLVASPLKDRAPVQ